MLTAIFLTVLYGAVWGFLWGGLDAIFIIKGFLASANPLPQILRGFIAMLIANFVTGLIFGAAGAGLIGMVVAVIVFYYSRPFVLSRWRW